jgi:hypothetical protein
MSSRSDSRVRGMEAPGTRDMWSGTKTLVFSSNFTMGPLFSRGVLLAAAAGEPTEIAFFDRACDKLPHGAAQLPARWISEASTSVRNFVPVAIELRAGVPVRHDPLSFEHVLLEDVQGLVFRDERERDRVLNATFGDYSLKNLDVDTRVQPEAFIGPDETVGPAKAEIDGDPKRLRIADAVAGMYFSYFARCGGYQRVVDIEASDGVGTRLRKVIAGLERSGETFATLDELLSVAAGRVLIRYPVRLGWPAREVLDSLKSEGTTLLASAAASDERLSGELARWHERAAAVLEEKGPEPQLRDDQHLCARALMLLLLRGGDPDELKGNPGAGALVIGKEVALLALALAGLRSGLRALPSELKIDHGRGLTRAWLEFGSRQFVNWLAGTSLLRFGLQIEYRRVGTLQGEWQFKDANDVLMSRAAEFDADLVRIHSIGRSLGFEFEETKVGELSTRAGKSQRIVRLAVIGDSSEARIVRFCTPLQDPPKKRPAKVTARGLGLPGDDLLEMLLTNADPGVNCRIGIDRAWGVPMVLADQLMATLDVQEFRRHLLHVVEIADRWAEQHPVKAKKSRKTKGASRVEVEARS